MDDGCYVVKNGEVYKVDLPVSIKPTKTVNIMTGEIHYPTNYDKITHMSVEELAEYLSRLAECNRGCRLDCGDSCIGAWIDWLEQETKT